MLHKTVSPLVKNLHRPMPAQVSVMAL
jgi:hypothetical protein